MIERNNGPLFFIFMGLFMLLSAAGFTCIVIPNGESQEEEEEFTTS